MNSDMLAINCSKATFKIRVEPPIIKYSRSKRGICIREVDKGGVKDQESIKYLVEDPII
jgi:hypothetical protein